MKLLLNQPAWAVLGILGADAAVPAEQAADRLFTELTGDVRIANGSRERNGQISRAMPDLIGRWRVTS
jgi:hypothetical protein